MPDLRKIAYRVCVARVDEYDRVKRILNRGTHPTFIGRSQYARWAHNGGGFVFQIDGDDAATALVETRRNVLMVLNVIPRYRGTGIGTQIIGFLKPNFVRAVESAVPWFERQGYQSIGDWKIGRRLRTRVMVRAALIPLAGRLRSRIAKDQGALEPAAE